MRESLRRGIQGGRIIGALLVGHNRKTPDFGLSGPYPRCSIRTRVVRTALHTGASIGAPTG
jgi:hypothetical protein